MNLPSRRERLLQYAHTRDGVTGDPMLEQTFRDDMQAAANAISGKRIAELESKLEAVTKERDEDDAELLKLQFVNEALGRSENKRKELESRLPRWLNAVTEQPTEDGEYIVARREEVFGGWQISFDHFEVESREWASDDEGPKALLWMRYPDFPEIVVERQKP